MGRLSTVAGLAMLMAFTSRVSAATIYSTSFESPAYASGTTVVGVDGWTVGSGTSASQTVSGTRASDGTQSLYFDNTGANSSFYSVVHSLGAFAPNALTLSVDLYIPGTNGADRLAEAMFSTGTMGSCVLGLSIDGAGDIRMGKAWSALYSATPIFATAAAGTFADRWLTATLTFDPATAAGTVTVAGFGGATPSFTSSFATVTTPTNTNLGSDYIGTTARTGGVYYDKLTLSAVPEPSTTAGLFFGAMALGVVIRRRVQVV